MFFFFYVILLGEYLEVSQMLTKGREKVKNYLKFVGN